MNAEVLTGIAMAITSFNSRIAAIEQDYVYGKTLINKAILSSDKKSNKAKSKKQSGAT